MARGLGLSLKKGNNKKMSPIDRPHDIQFRLPRNKVWMKDELVRIAKDNGLPLSQVMTLIITSWLKGKTGKKISLGV